MDTKNLKENFSIFFSLPEKIIKLKGDGSDRKIFRIYFDNTSVIGVIGVNKAENDAFVYFTRHFKNHHLPVPDIYGYNQSKGIYFEQDLGDQTLFSWMQSLRNKHFPHQVLDMYKRIMEYLIQFQLYAGRSLNYHFCYQYNEFGRNAMLYDLEYFRQRFLDVFIIDYNKYNLLKDFDQFTDYLVREDADYFLYRDFQSRNVMIKDQKPWFIDYQSGRKGALQYDVASILYDAKADIPDPIRTQLLNHYLKIATDNYKIDPEKFLSYYDGFVLMRIMQAFGAYGYLSIIKGKNKFFSSVPFAIKNIESILNKKPKILTKLPTLSTILFLLVDKYKNGSLTIDSVTNKRVST